MKQISRQLKDAITVEVRRVVAKFAQELGPVITQIQTAIDECRENHKALEEKVNKLNLPIKQEVEKNRIVKVINDNKFLTECPQCKNETTLLVTKDTGKSFCFKCNYEGEF